MNNWIIVILFVLLLGAVVMDLRTGKIWNKYNFPFLVLGVSIRLIFGGLAEIVDGALGIILPMVLLMVFFSSGILGAGDIKLFCAIGAFVGLRVIWIIVYSFVLCAVYGLVLAVIRLLKGFFEGRIREGIVDLFVRKGRYTKVAFSVFILGGFIWYLLKGGMGLGI